MELIKTIYNKIVNYFKPVNVKDTPEYKTLQKTHNQLKESDNLLRLAYGHVQEGLLEE